MYDIRKNTKRLVNALDAVTDNTETIKKMAELLHYDNTDDLVQDINSAFSFYEQYRTSSRQQ